MALIRIKTSQIAAVRSAIATKRQNGRCPLCTRSFGTRVIECLDHDHVTGLIRGVLCKNCNGIEGKIKNLAARGRVGLTSVEYLQKIIDYWTLYETDRTGLLHPLHLTPDEKRIKTNTKARKKRAAAKKVK